MQKTLDIKNNKFLTTILENIIAMLIKQFKQNSSECNKVIHMCFKKKEDNKAKYNPEQVKNVEEIWKQIQVFVWFLSITPKYWVLMLKNQQIHAEQTEYIDLHVFTTLIYKRLIKEGLQYSVYFSQFADIISQKIFVLLEEISEIICDFYNRSRKMLTEDLDEVSTSFQNSAILNIYTLYKILRDLSKKQLDKIAQEGSEGIFKNLEPQIGQYFAHYAVEKHEVIKMTMQKGTEHKKHTPTDITERIMLSKKVSWREAINEDGDNGIFIELKNYNEDKDQQINQNYLIKLDQDGQIQLINGKSLTKKWKVEEKAQQNFNIAKLIKNKKAFAQRMRDTTLSPKQFTLVDHVSSVGGSLGKCLADIDTYDNVGDFVTDLSKKVAIGGSFNYILSTIPILAYFFVAGGFTYSFYYIFSNKTHDTKKKLEQLGSITIDTVGSIGSGLLGAIIGQSVIPIPVLGAFIGGLVGGLVGEIGGKKISSMFQSLKFKSIIQSLHKSINPNGSWQPNKHNLKILGLNYQNFYETIPPYLQNKIGCDRNWLTLICFTLITFSQSKLRAKFMQKKVKQLQKRKAVLKQDEVQDSQEYPTSLDIMCSMDYLEKQDISYIYVMSDIEKMVTQMFSRLK